MTSLYLAMDIHDKQTINMLRYCQTLVKQAISGTFVDESTFHITIDYLNDNDKNADLVISAMLLFKERYLPAFKPFYVFGEHVNRFDGGACWLDVNNAFSLYQIRYLIRKLLKEVGYKKIKDTYDDYTPHITLAYDVYEDCAIHFDKVPVLVDNITLWASPKCNGAYIDNCLYQLKL